MALSLLETELTPSNLDDFEGQERFDGLLKHLLRGFYPKFGKAEVFLAPLEMLLH